MILFLYKEVYLAFSEADNPLPPMVKSLLQDYNDVFPDEVPHELPPLRGIEH